MCRDGGADPRTCFVKGTLVKTANGFVPIEQIKAGDQVWSYNERTKSLQLSRVKQTFIRRTQRVYTLTYDSGTRVETTGEHPFNKNGQDLLYALGEARDGGVACNQNWSPTSRIRRWRCVRKSQFSGVVS